MGKGGDDLEEKGLFEYVKKRLGAAQKGKRKNASVKNTLFNQRLRAYLKARQQLIGRPMKVQLEGKQILTKLDGPKALVNEEGELEPIEVKTEVTKPDEKIEDFTNLFGTPKESRQQSRRRKASEKDEELKERQRKLFALISDNSNAFGVVKDEDGILRILNPKTKRIVKGSDVVDVVKRLTSRRASFSPETPGFIYLNKKIMENEWARKLIDPFYLQHGKGCPGIKPRIMCSFRPTKWTK
jgi:hypothetical protein